MIDSLLNFVAGKLKNGIQIDLWWTNSSPSSSFAAQTIPLVNTNDYYSFILVELLYNTDSSERKKTIIIPYGTNHRFDEFGNLASTSATTAFSLERYVGFYSTGTVVGACYKKVLTASTKAAADNSYLIPTRIWGIRVN